MSSKSSSKPQVQREGLKNVFHVYNRCKKALFTDYDASGQVDEFRTRLMSKKSNKYLTLEEAVKIASEYVEFI